LQPPFFATERARPRPGCRPLIRPVANQAAPRGRSAGRPPPRAGRAGPATRPALGVVVGLAWLPRPARNSLDGPQPHLVPVVSPGWHVNPHRGRRVVQL